MSRIEYCAFGWNERVDCVHGIDPDPVFVREGLCIQRGVGDGIGERAEDIVRLTGF